MATTAKQLEARLVRVERELAELREALASKSTTQPWYQQIAGSFAGDDAFAEIIRFGRLIRASKNPSNIPQ